MLKTAALTALGYLAIASLLGLALRYTALAELPITYRYFVHGHSHIAMLGWIYIALTTLIYKAYLHTESVPFSYKILFVCTQITLLGMLIAFPLQGYALFSILFSSLFLIASYGFIYFFFKNVYPENKNTFSYHLIKQALGFLGLSSIGAWSLGIIMTTAGNTSIYYKLAIYFFLHFQYNGWMLLAVLGLFFYVLEKKNIVFSKEKTLSLRRWIAGSVYLTYLLSALFAQPHESIYALAGIGVLLQLMAFAKVWKMIRSKHNAIQQVFPQKIFWILALSGLLWVVKLLLQTLSVFPYFADLAYQFPDFIIGYLHWVFLGIISLALFGLTTSFDLLTLSQKLMSLFLIGFAATELLIFYRAMAQWLDMPLPSQFLFALFLASLVLFIGITGLLLKNISILFFDKTK